MIFDVKMEYFLCEARLVAGLHMIYPPATITYASVVSRETVRIDLTLTALNYFTVKASDIQNAYFTVSVTEKIWKILGPAYGEDTVRKAIVVCDLYGLKSAGAAFWNHLVTCMHNLGFLSCPTNLNLWIKPTIIP